MNIELQMNIAAKLLHKLHAVDPHAIIAGGAPRNWVLGKECNDLDIYLHVPLEEASSSTSFRFKSLGLDCKPFHRNPSDFTVKPKLLSVSDLLSFPAACEEKDTQPYNEMRGIKLIYEGKFDGMDFQIMVMKEPTFKHVVDDFGVSICEAWWCGGGCDIKVTLNFLLSLYCKVLFCRDNYSGKELHVQKMVGYFPDFERLSNVDIVSYREAVEAIVIAKENVRLLGLGNSRTWVSEYEVKRYLMDEMKDQLNF